MLDENNVLVKSFRMAKDRILSEGCTTVKLKLIGRRGGDGRTYNLPSANEVVVLIVGDIDDCQGERDILIETQTGRLQRINQLNPAYLGLQYPLLFPFGEDGYREDIPLSGTNNNGRGRKNISMREFCAFKLHERESEAKTILYSGCLTQQFVVDVYTMIESSRLTYIRLNQKRLRCEMYRGLQDALLRGDRDASIQGKRIILPSTFTGGARYMIQNYQDDMAICRWVGYPDLFLTLTCNPKWPEIVRFLDEVGLKSEDRPDIICRIFKVNIEALIKDLRKNKVFGEIKGVVYTIEFQKRGLPHGHILLFLSRDFKCRSPEEIDSIISAEIPDENEDPEYYASVRDMMIHGPCGAYRKESPCMINSHCSKHFPKKFCNTTTIDEDGYAVYRRRDNGRTVSKNGVLLDNRYVVPHNRYLLLTYGAHLNVEWCTQSRAIKYLFKYVNKGNDRVTATFYQTNTDDELEANIDEVNLYYDCRYISSCEEVWRIFDFEIQYKDPPVEPLSFHLPKEQNVVFSDTDDIQSVMNRETVHQSMFLGWMDANKKYPEGRDLTYSEYPTRFVWKTVSREWMPRKKGFSIGRLFYVPPGSGDLYYFRCRLNIVRGATSYADLRRLNGTQYGTYRDACYALGLLNDDNEYIDGITEASHFASGKSLRSLFVNLLVSSSISRPEVVWNSCWKLLSEDILYKQRIYLNHPALVLTEEQIKGFTLAEIEHVLRTLERSLKEFNTLPFPSQEFFQASSNRLIFDELNYDRELLGKEHYELLSKLNLEQRNAYDKILESSLSDIGNIFFVYGYGGTGKTYVWRTISAALRSKGHIVLNVASSGIASLLLPGGRTAHSRFSIPFNIDENSVCNIKQGSPLAELILKCKLIIWDEAPMMHRHCFEALDRSMRDILKRTDLSRSDIPFGGKTVVFGGDFRQILPVIPKGSRQDIVHATINSSHLWSDCIVLRLTTNMRLKSSSSTSDSSLLREYVEWIANIGDGKVNEPKDGVVSIDIPDKFLIDGGNDPIQQWFV